jgi:hypothetical protein
MSNEHSIPLLADKDIPPDLLNLLNQYPRINIYTLLAHSPTVCKPWIDLINGIYNSGFSPRLREIALVRIGTVMPSHYELHQHQFIALKNGVTEDEIKIITCSQQVTSLDEQANLICRVVDELHQKSNISDATFKLLTNHFSTNEMVSLGVIIAMYFAVGMFVNFTRTEIESSNPLQDFKGFKE